MPTPKRIGILSGGGDCPGINAVIRAVVLDAAAHGTEVVGILDGFLGLIEDRTRPLTRTDVAEILTVGGSILGCSNKSNPSKLAVGKDKSGNPIFEDARPKCWKTIDKHGLDALAVIGGDGTMTCLDGFINGPGAKKMNCVGIPKTIDNDIMGSDLTFGFLTAVETAADALDKVQTTAASHHRAIVVEVMGRHAGWICLFAGIASGAHVILLPEIPFDPKAVAAAVARNCDQAPYQHAVICIAEGATAIGQNLTVARIDPTSPEPRRLGGVSMQVSEQIEKMTGIESRYTVLGHIQRGGSPCAADRVLATQFGQAAMKLLREGAWQRLVVRQKYQITDISIRDAAQGQRLVPLDHPLIHAAREVGVSFGDETVK